MPSQVSRIEQLANRADEAEKKAEEAWDHAATRYPGAYTAGQAHYPIEQHEKAHKRAARFLAAASSARAKHRAAVLKNLADRRRTQETADALNAAGHDWISRIVPGDVVRFSFTNSGQTHYAIGRIDRVNARTFRQTVLRIENATGEAIEDGRCGRSWAIDKFGTGDNRILERISAT